MRIDEISKLKKNDYIVLLPKTGYDIRDSVEYSFKNVVFLDYDVLDKDVDQFIKGINDKKIQLIIFDYDDLYRLVLPYIHKDIKIKWILKNGFAPMTDGAVRAAFTNLMEFYDRDLIDCIGCLDHGSYKVLEHAGYKAKHVVLDVKEDKKEPPKNTKSIGLIGNDYNPNHNIYNELTAVKMTDYDYVKVIKNMPATKHFIEFFDIKEQTVETLEEVMSNNFVNLYCNFTLTNPELVLKSMDSGIPCLLGNTNLFDDYKLLKEYLVLKSDDDVNEIASKIDKIRDNRNIILKEYEGFRKKYQSMSIKSIKEFLG